MHLTTKQENNMENFDREILERIGKRLLNKKQTIAVAESVTAGILQYAFSSITGAAQFFQGGVTAYNIAQKFRHLKVEPIHALSVNCVSPQVAEEMALHVCELFAGNWGIGVTGYASPVPESGNKLFAYYAIARNNKIISKGKLSHAEAAPSDIQFYYANAILKKLDTALRP